MSTLTPYDQGTVFEPTLWVEKRNGQYRAGTGGQRPAGDDDFGRVDFDNDEGATVVAGLRAMPLPDSDGARIEFGGVDYAQIHCVEPSARIRIVGTAPAGTRAAAIEHAEHALDQCTGPETDPETRLADLLADLMHWAEENDVLFDVSLRRARNYVDAEEDDE